MAAFLESVIGVAVLLILILVGVAANFGYSSKREHDEKRRRCARYINNCVDEVNLEFGVAFPLYVLHDRDLEVNYQRKVITPQGEYALYVNPWHEQAAMTIKALSSNRLVRVEIYRRSNNHAFGRSFYMTRKEYIDFMLREGYHFGQCSLEMIYNGLCDANTEYFLITAYPSLYFIKYWEKYLETDASWCENFIEAYGARP